MGFLTEGRTLPWEEISQDIKDYIKEHGVIQFINIYRQNKDFIAKSFKWGDEVCLLARKCFFFAVLVWWCFFVCGRGTLQPLWAYLHAGRVHDCAFRWANERGFLVSSRPWNSRFLDSRPRRKVREKDTSTTRAQIHLSACLISSLFKIFVFVCLWFVCGLFVVCLWFVCLLSVEHHKTWCGTLSTARTSGCIFCCAICRL